jgi:hypothetical protein
VDSPNGIRFSVSSYGAGRQFQVMLHKARALDRELNCFRDSEDPQYGVSDYDDLVTRLQHEPEGWFVYILRRVIGQVEELSA